MSAFNIDLAELIVGVESDFPGAEPLALITQAQSRARQLGELGDQLVGHFVDQARAAGASWSQIGDAIGVSKQAAQQRWVSPTLQRFTPRARNVLVAAQERARTDRVAQVGTEQLLFGLFSEPEGLAGMALAELGGSLDTVRQAVEARMPAGDTEIQGHIPFGAQGKSVLKQAVKEALDLDHNYVGTEHLLLALLSTEGLARQILGNLGISYDAARDLLVERLAEIVRQRSQS